MRQRARPPYPSYILLGLILVVAGVLRLAQLDWGLPTPGVNRNSLNEDEWRMLESVMEIDVFKGQLVPGQLVYATANIYLFSVVASVLDRLGVIEYQHDVNYYLGNPQRLRELYLLGRYLTVGYSLAAIAVLFLLGRAMYKPSTGLAAAALFAVIPAHVIEAHYFKNNVPLMFWCVVLGWCTYSLYRNPTRRNHILAGLALGCATATQYNGIFFLGPLLWARLSRVRNWRRWWLVLADKRVLVLYSTAFGAFMLLSPFSLLMKEQQGRSVEDIFKAFRRDRFYTYSSPGINYYFQHLFPFAVSEPVLYLTIASLPVLARRKKGRLLLVITLGLASLTTVTNLKVMRYVLYSSPYLCLCSARLLTLSIGNRKLRVIQKLGFATALVWSGCYSITALDLMAQKDPRLQAQEWLLTNLPSQAKLVTLHQFRGFYPPITDGALGYFTVLEDVVLNPDYLWSCSWPVVTNDLELYGIHAKYLTHSAAYREHAELMAPLLDGTGYLLRFEVKNQALLWNWRFSGRWAPLDWWSLNPKILIFVPDDYGKKVEYDENPGD